MIHAFKFADKMHTCLHASHTSITLPDNSRMHLEVAVVELQVTFLLGLDILRKFGITLDLGTGHMRIIKEADSFLSIMPGIMRS